MRKRFYGEQGLGLEMVLVFSRSGCWPFFARSRSRLRGLFFGDTNRDLLNLDTVQLLLVLSNLISKPSNDYHLTR
ncbi:hypothetical protein KC19_1G079700 [Ceratodon purpureus]|uniref:Uncharacterized protein n=1 Tax=Ceratodon purpureus TaxID=3225 RepID=A0A8T0J5U4_CERPU|nr:hypothetical protein KC19_1G079700 [Ceratodon purpureus]